jgi:CheY-like chemotaxis protein
MFPHGFRFLTGVAFLIVLMAHAAAQPPEKDKAPPPKDKEAPAKDEDDYRQFFKKPETPLEFWKAMQFEIEVGRFDLAAGHLHGLLEKNPTDQEWVQLEEKYGMAAFLKLRNLDKWSSDEKVQTRARKEVDDLIEKASAAVRKQRSDPQRIAMFIKNLTATDEERIFALRELYRSGALVIPPLIEQLRLADVGDRVVLLKALEYLTRGDTLPPLLAALDSNDGILQVELIDVLLKKGATDAVPSLWFLAASPERPEAVRRKATEALAVFLRMPASKLPSSKSALTREAERYYKHQVSFIDPKAVTVWRWDGAKVVAGWPGAPTISASRAEEYYGLRYIDQALKLDPTYQPAQVLRLSLVLDKTYEEAGLARPLAKSAPEVHDLLATVNPDLLTAVLERGLSEQRTSVILGAVRALGDLAEVRATKPSTQGEPALIRALFYPDRRIHLSAADALLRIPGAPPPAAGVRTVDLLRRALAAEPQAAKAVPKVLVGFAGEDTTVKVADAVAKAGYEPIRVTTGRDALRRLNEASDVEVLLLDANLPEPGLTSLLAQLRADSNAGRLPVLLAAPLEREDALRRYTERMVNVTVIPHPLALSVKELQAEIKARAADAGGPLSEEELKEYAEKSIRYLARMAKGELTGYDFRPAADVILEALRAGKVSPEGQLAAIEAVGRLPGSKAQTELFNVVLEEKRALPLRNAAASELLRHIQQHSVLLTRDQIANLGALHVEAGLDAGLKANVAVVLGSLRPDAKATGERLLKYQPPVPGKAEAPKEK